MKPPNGIFSNSLLWPTLKLDFFCGYGFFYKILLLGLIHENEHQWKMLGKFIHKILLPIRYYDINSWNILVFGYKKYAIQLILYKWFFCSHLFQCYKYLKNLTAKVFSFNWMLVSLKAYFDALTQLWVYLNALCVFQIFPRLDLGGSPGPSDLSLKFLTH